MVARVPDAVVAAWGQEVATEFATWLEVVMEQDVVGRREWIGRMDQLDRRFGDLDVRLDGLSTGLGERIDRLSAEVTLRLDRQTVDMTGRMDKLNGDLNGRMDKLTGEMSGRMDSQSADLGARMERQFLAFSERLDRTSLDINARLDRHMRWSIGLLGLFATIVSVLLAVETLLR